MKESKISKIKKYIFLISVLFLVIPLIHLTYTYIYSDAKYKPLSWGSISEWIIWNPPDINPLKLQKWNNKYVISYLYRWLLSYDIKKKNIVSDIASCDTSNLLHIECYLKNNIKWSNNTIISTKDIISTYKILKTTNVNPLIKSLLSDTKIIEKENMIIFNNKKRDINFLNVLFTPIVNNTILDNIGEKELYWSFPIIEGIYSWKYILSNIISNNIRWIIEVILIKNQNYYQNKVYIEKIILKFFKNTSDFLKHKNSINIFNDKNNILWNSIPRLQSYNYTIPQYVSVLINKNKIKNKNLRNYLLNSINRDNLIKIIWKDFFSPVYNPYLTKIKIDKESENKNITELFSKLWYYKKTQILKSFLENSWKKTYSWEVKIKKKNTTKSGSLEKIKDNSNSNYWITIKKITKEQILKDFGWKPKTIISPTFIDKYNFITKDNILLKWKVNKRVDNVYINNDKVWYNARKKEFFYTLKKSEWNISIWGNSYKIYYEVDGNKNLQEEIFFIYNPIKSKLERDKDIFINSLIENQNKKIESKKIESKININVNVNVNNVDEEKIKKINSLDDKLFYDKELTPLTLNLIYINSEKDIETTANYIKSSFIQQWIKININPISISQLPKILSNHKEINKSNSWVLNDNTKTDYDMILVWINLWIFNFNIFPYFHSSQAQQWYNFTNLKKTNIDILLEELKWKNLSKDKIKELEKKVLDILKQDQIIKVLYTPIITNQVDKNIKNYSLPNAIPNKSTRLQAIYDSYLLEEKFINLENKSLYNFIKYLYEINRINWSSKNEQANTEFNNWRTFS